MEKLYKFLSLLKYLQQDLQPFLSKGEDLNPRQVTKNGEPAQGNEVCSQLPTPVKNQPENTESPHAYDLTPERYCRSDFPQIKVPTPLR